MVQGNCIYLADLLPDYQEDTNDEGHFGHNSTLFICAYTHIDPVTNVDDVLPALPYFEDGVTLATKRFLKINLGTTTDPRPTFLGCALEDFERCQVMDLLRAYKDCFTWSYEEMFGLSLDVALLWLTVKQAKQKFSVAMESLVAAEITKLKEVKFIKEVQYSKWLTNIVLVKKKNVQLCICVDFRNLNKACPKDTFHLPLPNLLLDNVVMHQMFSFIDGFNGYNQICMALEDEEKTMLL